MIDPIFSSPRYRGLVVTAILRAAAIEAILGQGIPRTPGLNSHRAENRIRHGIGCRAHELQWLVFDAAETAASKTVNGGEGNKDVRLF